jgi:hypothetical protein
VEPEPKLRIASPISSTTRHLVLAKADPQSEEIALPLQIQARGFGFAQVLRIPFESELSLFSYVVP